MSLIEVLMVIVHALWTAVLGLAALTAMFWVISVALMFCWPPIRCLALRLLRLCSEAHWSLDALSERWDAWWSKWE